MRNRKPKERRLVERRRQRRRNLNIPVEKERRTLEDRRVEFRRKSPRRFTDTIGGKKKVLIDEGSDKKTRRKR